MNKSHTKLHSQLLDALDKAIAVFGHEKLARALIGAY